jgi:hypothetical protein
MGGSLPPNTPGTWRAPRRALDSAAGGPRGGPGLTRRLEVHKVLLVHVGEAQEAEVDVGLVGKLDRAQLCGKGGGEGGV